MCRSEAERKIRRLEETELQESTETAFEAYGKQLKAVPSFKYLGRIMTAGEDNWPAVVGNLEKERKIWGRIKRILEQGGGGQENIGKCFQGGSSTGAAVWGGDVGVDSKNREGVGLVHAWGRETDHRETSAKRGGQETVLTLPGGRHEGSGI